MDENGSFFFATGLFLPLGNKISLRFVLFQFPKCKLFNLCKLCITLLSNESVASSCSYFFRHVC